MEIKFVARNPYYRDVAPKPYPAKNHLPEWYKNMDPYNPDRNGIRKLSVGYGNSNVTPKMCTPMYDSFATGYIIPLWTDVDISEHNDQLLINWRVKYGDPPFTMHGGIGNGDDGNTGVTTPDGYHDTVFKWMNGWDIRTPKGYSCLITDPYANENSPFKAIGGVVDTDKLTLSILPPVWVKKGFQGIVEKGTPMVQVIPFKRDNWKSSFDFLEEGEYNKMEDTSFGSNIRNHYKRFVWSRKSFE